ncbi:MAG: nucleotidyltransferase substrate binding protein [Helicobacteraceae bacterium]|jgi:nucleotidyltransferase substrate binding protein (TIGR01987 family)|nr:nucleotidyltransferase substrate binding protein [Helicobacteraceae bacterium]
MHSDFRWKQRYQNYAMALAELENSLLKEEYTVLERSGLIQLFEVSFELAWKMLKDLLFYEGYNVTSPRDVIRQAFANGLILDGESWLKALDSRNLFAHSYSGELAQQAVSLIREKYAPFLFALRETLKERLS